MKLERKIDFLFFASFAALRDQLFPNTKLAEDRVEQVIRGRFADILCPRQPVAKRHRKLARHTVPGFIIQNKFRPEGTVETIRTPFPSSLRDVIHYPRQPGTLSPANFHCSFGALYFPIQNCLKIESSRSSVAVLPTISPTALTAIRKSIATNSSVAFACIASSVCRVAARERFSAS